MDYLFAAMLRERHGPSLEDGTPDLEYVPFACGFNASRSTPPPRLGRFTSYGSPFDPSRFEQRGLHAFFGCSADGGLAARADQLPFALLSVEGPALKVTTRWRLLSRGVVPPPASRARGICMLLIQIGPLDVV